MPRAAAHPPELQIKMHDLTGIGFPEIPLVGAYVNRNSREGLATHTHPGILEICYLVSGEQNYHVDGRDYVLKGNDVFVTFPGELHSTGSAPQGVGSLFWVQVALAPAPRRFLGQTVAQAALLLRRLRQLPVRHFPGDPRLKPMFEEILSLAAPRGDLERLQLSIRVIDWLLLVIKCAERAAGGTPARRRLPPDLRRVCQALEAEPEAPWPIETMAAVARLSPSRFKAKFKAVLGVPPREYLLRLRVERARERLRHSAVPITALAFELGFSSSQHFATVYKKFTLRRPRDERAPVR